MALIFCAAANSAEFPSGAYAWAENSGWINLNPTHQSVVIGPDGLTGYAWAENTGWIKFGSDGGPPYANSGADNWGVNLDEAGNLSGFAWGETIGWINFSPTHGGVVYDEATSTASGFAWSENAGWVYFHQFDLLFSDGFEGS